MEALELIFVLMETLTITIRSKRARRLIENLAASRELIIEQIRVLDANIDTKVLEDNIDMSWVPESQKEQAVEILDAFVEAKAAIKQNRPLKSARDFLNEL